ncbi:hypothetical protein ABZU92_24725 [Micromonospora arida]|uniref:hypothetical protein n=1 Tax=Micromonospora arida TaxID=2203715 RepID=UPI0033AE7017
MVDARGVPGPTDAPVFLLEVGYQVLSVVMCLVLTAQLAVAVSIGVRPSMDVP